MLLPRRAFFRQIVGLAPVIVLLILVPPPRGAATPPAGPDLSPRPWKILHIMSYHSPWQWTDGQLEGFKAALQGLNIDYQVMQMDLKRRTDPDWVERSSRAARDLIEHWQPDLVYATDDAAQEHVVKHYLNQSLPFVFSGVNADPAVYGYPGCRNVTGVLEEEHFVETVKLLRQIAPAVRRIAILCDDDPMWRPVLARLMQKAPQLPGVAVVSWEVIPTFAHFQQRLAELQTEVDALGFLGIFTFKDENGQNVPYKTVCRWVLDHSRLPDFSFWKDRVSYGTLCAVTVSEYEQGYAAGLIARGILLEGRSPSSYPMRPTSKGVPMINLFRAKKLGLPLKAGLLLSATIVPDIKQDY